MFECFIISGHETEMVLSKFGWTHVIIIIITLPDSSFPLSSFSISLLFCLIFLPSCLSQPDTLSSPPSPVLSHTQPSPPSLPQQARDAWGLLKMLVEVPCECLASQASEQRRVLTTQRLFMHQARLYLENRYTSTRTHAHMHAYIHMFYLSNTCVKKCMC